MAAGHNVSDVYTVTVGRTDSSLHNISVYCDMNTDGGGWTVKFYDEGFLGEKRSILSSMSAAVSDRIRQTIR